MSISLAQLAYLVGGQLFGDADVEIIGAATLGTAQEGEITLAGRAELTRELAQSRATAVVVGPDFLPEGIPCVQVDDAAAAFAAIVAHFRPPRQRTRIGVSPRAFVSPTARLADDVDVYPGAFVGDDVEIGTGSTIHPGVAIMGGCKLGSEVTVFPNAVLYEDTTVGDRSTIHAGAVLGCFGFGYETVEGRHRRCPQLGHVEVRADVEIGACTTVDRGTYGPTVVGEGTKMDNQVMVGHNCRIGNHNILCSQVGIAGSTSTGDYVVMAGQVGVADHVHIGNQSVLGAKAGVMADVPEGVTYLGIPATPERMQKQMVAAYFKLPEMRKQHKVMKRTVDKLAKAAESAPEKDAA